MEVQFCWGVSMEEAKNKQGTQLALSGIKVIDERKMWRNRNDEDLTTIESQAHRQSHEAQSERGDKWTLKNLELFTEPQEVDKPCKTERRRHDSNRIGSRAQNTLTSESMRTTTRTNETASRGGSVRHEGPVCF